MFPFPLLFQTLFNPPPRRAPEPPKPVKEPEKPKEILRSHRDGEDLTADEVKIFRETLCCPDCGEHELLAGPEGGCCINVKCGNPECGSKFNEMGVCGIMRISDPQPLKPRPVPEGPHPYRGGAR